MVLLLRLLENNCLNASCLQSMSRVGWVSMKLFTQECEEQWRVLRRSFSVRTPLDPLHFWLRTCSAAWRARLRRLTAR